MKALSIRQPWAWCILSAGKTLENRDWQDRNPGLRFRGRFILHASAGMTGAEYDECLDFLEAMPIPRPFGKIDFPDPKALTRGALVGLATVTGIVRSSDSPWFMGPLALQLEDIQTARTPVPWKGALGFFDVPDEAAMDMGLPLKAFG